MSEGLPVVSGRQAIKALKRLGFDQVTQRGSHVKMRRGERTAIVPVHDELARGTLRSILRQADLSNEEFLEALKAGGTRQLSRLAELRSHPGSLISVGT